MSNFFTSTTEAHEWVDWFQSGNDALTTESLPKFFTKDAKITFGNVETMTGYDALGAFLQPQFEGLEMMKHVVAELDLAPSKILFSCHISYIIKGDPEHKPVTIPAYAQMKLRAVGEDDEKLGARKAIIEAFQVWIDPAPVAARAKEVFGVKE